MSPTPPPTDDTLLASVQRTDADLDEALQRYAWSVDGTALDATGPRLDGAPRGAMRRFAHAPETLRHEGDTWPSSLALSSPPGQKARHRVRGSLE